MQNKNLKNKIKAQYGNKRNRVYGDFEMQKIRSYFDTLSSPNKFSMDDRTWNDLYMDRMFQEINHTYSSVGEEVLYRLLREPEFDESLLGERKKLISYFEEEEEIRNRFQMVFYELGRTKKESLITYLRRIEERKKVSFFRYFYHALLLPLSVGIMFVSVPAGILSAIVSIIFNLVTYFQTKSRIEVSYQDALMVSYLIAGCRKIKKIPVGDRVKPYLQKLEENLKNIESIPSLSRLLGANVNPTFSMSLVNVVADYIRMMTHIDFWAFEKIDRKISEHREAIENLIQTLGYLEAVIAIGSYRKTLTYFTEGEIRQKEPELKFREAIHPLNEKPVPNDFNTKGNILITGSNASGKSTFLRLTALLTLCGETIVTIPAKEFTSSFFRIYTSMSLSDNLAKKESYFTAEIKAVKRMIDALSEETPLLICIDEVLRGTNTTERVAASTEILHYFSKQNAITLAATHDLELTKLLEKDYRNYHFTETVTETEITFPYKIKEGPADTKNGIRLLETLDYPKEITENARKRADYFTKEGIWKND